MMHAALEKISYVCSHYIIITQNDLFSVQVFCVCRLLLHSCRVYRYGSWMIPRKTIISRREFVKLHIITDAKGRKIVSCAVTRGPAHDSPVFREMIKRVPDGAGCVMLDAGHDAARTIK